jgi:hypothetical protein
MSSGNLAKSTGMCRCSVTKVTEIQYQNEIVNQANEFYRPFSTVDLGVDRMCCPATLNSFGGFGLALLKIVRASGYADRLRAYKVIVDGKTAGEIRNGETKESPISRGQHDLSLKVDWCGSKTIQFTVADGDVLTFDAKSNLRGPRLLLALWYSLFARGSYLLIEQR